VWNLPQRWAVRHTVQQSPSPVAKIVQPTPTPDPYVVSVGQGGLPRTASDVQALRIRLKDLREQLQDAAERRRNIARQLLDSDPSARAGIQLRLGELDSRILRIEKDISATTEAITNAPRSAVLEAARIGVPGDVVNRIDNNIVPIVSIVSVFVLAPFSVALARLIWRRGSITAPRAAPIDQATQHQLEQLQQSVDTIAIEVERIAEGQRFVTKLLSGAGTAESLRLAREASLVSERG
jgi:hypothetical protein